MIEFNIITPHDIGDCVVVARGSELQIGIINGIDIKTYDSSDKTTITYRICFAKSHAIYDAKEDNIVFNLKTLKGTAVYCGLPDNKYNEFSKYVDDLRQKFTNIISGVRLEEDE